MKKSKQSPLFYLTLIILISFATYLGYLFLKPKIFQSSSINVTSISSCPAPAAFTAHDSITVPYNITYPATVRSNSGSWLMFTGGIVSLLPSSIKDTLPVGHIRFPYTQEEVWVSSSTDLNTYSTAKPTFTLLPETTVAFKNGASYQSVYPDGFKTGCIGLTADTQCNAQINDPTVVRFGNGSIYLYFTILENYRWYFGTVDGIPAPLVNGNPSRPDLQNIHSIGLAVSGDDGKNWAFVKKVILEHEKDTDNNPILGAWSPSAVVSSPDNVDIYFHDAFGTKQYVAHLAGGTTPTGIERLNKHDTTYRTNLDIMKNGDYLEATYNDPTFSVMRTYFTNPNNFGTLCPETPIVSGFSPDTTRMWPTPHQVISGDRVHLFFWSFANPSYLNHWSRPNTPPTIPSPTPTPTPTPTSKLGDLNTDGHVNIFDYNELISGLGTKYTIFDYSNIVANFGK